MRYLLIIAGLICLNLLNAQDTLNLTLSNPEPRVGDKVELSFSFSFFTDDLENQIDDEIVMTASSSIYGISSNDKFIRMLEFTRTGKHTIGPFKFDFNGKMIVTNSIIVNVAEELPFEEGVWIRLTSDKEGNKFLILEQLVNNTSDYSKEGNTTSYTVGGKLDENFEFAEIEPISEDGIRINFKMSKSNTRTRDNGDVYAPGLSYSFKKYQIEFDEGFDKTFVLKKKHLKYLPKNVRFSKIEIKR